MDKEMAFKKKLVRYVLSYHARFKKEDLLAKPILHLLRYCHPIDAEGLAHDAYKLEFITMQEEAAFKRKRI